MQKMINFDDVRSESTKEYDPSWPQIPDHPYKISTWGVVDLKIKRII